MAGMKPYSDPNPSVPGDASSAPKPLNAAAVTVRELVADQLKPGETNMLLSRAFTSVSPLTPTSGWIWYDSWLATVH
jgi:5-enolpyruvylshikimate-3-phosphate synthase